MLWVWLKRRKHIDTRHPCLRSAGDTWELLRNAPKAEWLNIRFIRPSYHFYVSTRIQFHWIFRAEPQQLKTCIQTCVIVGFLITKITGFRAFTCTYYWYENKDFIGFSGVRLHKPTNEVFEYIGLCRGINQCSFEPPPPHAILLWLC